LRDGMHFYPDAKNGKLLVVVLVCAVLILYEK